MKQDRYYIERVLKGDLNSFSYLVDKHQGMVYTIALRMLKNKEDAEELAQDTFVNAYNSLAKFKFESKFSTWLYRIVYNAAISKLRKNHLAFSDIEDAVLPDSEVVNTCNALNELTRQDQKKYINLAIDNLNEDDSVLLTMFYLNENSIEEISEVTGLSLSNVKVKLHRARKKLYDELKLILKEEVKSIL